MIFSISAHTLQSITVFFDSADFFPRADQTLSLQRQPPVTRPTHDRFPQAVPSRSLFRVYRMVSLPYTVQPAGKNSHVDVRPSRRNRPSRRANLTTAPSAAGSFTSINIESRDFIPKTIPRPEATYFPYTYKDLTILLQCRAGSCMEEPMQPPGACDCLRHCPERTCPVLSQARVQAPQQGDPGEP
jgi:hypothetical protein